MVLRKTEVEESRVLGMTKSRKAGTEDRRVPLPAHLPALPTDASAKVVEGLGVGLFKTRDPCLLVQLLAFPYTLRVKGPQDMRKTLRIGAEKSISCHDPDKPRMDSNCLKNLNPVSNRMQMPVSVQPLNEILRLMKSGRSTWFSVRAERRFFPAETE